MSTAPRVPSDLLREISPGTMAGFRASREAIATAGPLSKETLEMIMLGSFVTAGYEAAVKIHAKRLFDMAVPREAIHQVALATFGATTTISGVSRALQWIEDALA